MIDWARDNWDKLLSFLVAFLGAAFALYRKIHRKVIGIETKVDLNEKAINAHITDDQQLRDRLDKIIDKMDRSSEQFSSLNITVASHEVIIKEIREDIKELRDDVRFMIRRNNFVDSNSSNQNVVE